MLRPDGGLLLKYLPEVLLDVEARAGRLPDHVAQLALEYKQFAWQAAGPSWRWNSYCDVAVAIHAGRCGGARFRPETDLKVDRDFTLQLLASGMLVARAADLAFSAPQNGSNAGGLAPAYAQGGREARSSQRMAELWPGVCQPFTKPDGRPDVRIRWRALASPVPPR